MVPYALFYRFGVALFIGMLVGLQREYSYEEDRRPEEKTFAGVRTFALFGLLGCAGAYLADLLETIWIFVALLLILGAFIAVSYFVTASAGRVGMTTEVAALMTLVAGALCYLDQLALAVALGVVATALLSFKIELHGFASQLTREDVVAALKFAIITAIVLPVLPNDSFGPPPFDVLNPYKIWLIVVLISGISFLGYVLFKLVGGRRGIGLTGILGGLASSTATTLSFAERSTRTAGLARTFALAIMLAWTVMFGRIIVEVWAVNRALLTYLWVPIALTALAAVAYSVFLYVSPQQDDQEEVKISNPFELRTAITFGLLYAVVLLVARAAQLYLGDVGVYISSFVSGLADVDAITLSVAELSANGSLELKTAAEAIVIAAFANTLVKGGIVLASGSATLRRAILPGFVLVLATAAVVGFLI